jgi:hypothetical protein
MTCLSWKPSGPSGPKKPRAVHRPFAAVEDRAGPREDVDAMLARRGRDQRVGLFRPAGGGVQAPLQIARGLRPVERGQFHAPVFGKHQKIGPRLRRAVHPCAGLFLVGVPIRQEIERIGGGSDLHVRLLIQNCSGFCVFSAFADVAPAEMGHHAVKRRVSPCAPEPVERAVPLGPRGMIGGPHHPAEGDLAEAEPRRVRLPPVEEGMSRALPPILRKQNGFSAVEDVLHVDVRPFEGRREIVGMIGQRHARRRADHPVAVISGHHDAVAPGVAGEVSPLIGRVPVIEIGPVAEHRHAQPREIRHHVCDGGTEILPVDEAHRETCRTQSARL